MIFRGYKTRLTYPGIQGTVSTQSTPHPRVKVTPAGRGLASLGGSSATRPLYSTQSSAWAQQGLRPRDSGRA